MQHFKTYLVFKVKKLYFTFTEPFDVDVLNAENFVWFQKLV